MKILKNYYLKYYKEILIAIIFIIGEALCELQLPGYISNIISKGIAVNNQEIIKDYGIMMMLYTAGSVACAIVVGYFSAKVGAYVARDIRLDLYKKIIDFNYSEYEKFEMSSLVTRCTNDITQVQTFTSAFLRLSMLIPVMSIGGIIKALEYSSSIQSIENLIIIGIGSVLIIMAIGLVIVLPKVRLMQKQVDKINRVSHDALIGMMDIRSFNNEKFEMNRFDTVNKDLSKTTLFVNRIMQVLVPAMTTIMYVLSILVLIVIAKVVEDVAQIANMMAFIQYVMHVIISLTMVALIFFVMPRAAVAFKRIKEILDTQEKDKLDKGITIKDGSIKFEKVSFNFDKKGKDALKEVSFTIENGQKVAIVGATGAGKSSIIRLITKLIRKDSGNIFIGNESIDNISEEEIRDKVSCVMQKSILFKGTIKSNVAYSNQNMSEELIDSALTVSSAKEFVDNMSNSILSEVKQNGSNLSGGQKQRLNIARSVAKDSLIYIFDDSFSALDFKTDLKVRQEIDKFLKDKTIIVIAQRISTIKNADKIIVLDGGEVVDIGSHEKLMESCEKYVQLASSQLEEENE